MLIGTAAMAADLPTSGSGEFFLKNVGTGTYLKGDSYWGTKAVVWNDPYAVTLTYLNDGVYTIKSQQNNGGESQYLTDVEDLYVDGAAANMTFAEVDAVNHYYTIANAKGNLYATQVTEDGATLYKVMAGNVSTDYAKWQVISRDELVAALDAASPSNPVDATFFIKDAGIDVKSVNDKSWTKNNVDLGGGGNAGHSAESWNKSSFNLSQTITDLPNGKYRATCYGYYRWNNGGVNNNAAAVEGHANGNEVLNAIFFAGTKETPLMSIAGDADATSFCSTMGWDNNTPNNQWQAAACFTKGYYLNTIDEIVVTDGTLTIGVKKETQAGTDWCVFDEFKLYYLGEDLSIYQDAYNDAVAAANAVDQSAPMLGSALTDLQSAITNYGTGVNTSDKDALLTATSALSTATTNATTSITAYAKANTAIADAEALQTNHNFVTSEAATTFAEAIANIKTLYTNGILSNDAATNAATTLGVVAVGWHAAATNTPASNYMGSTWPNTLTINDWSVEGVTDGSDYLVPFFQDWIDNGESLASKTWTATLPSLPNGLYEVSAWVRVRAKNGTAATEATGITMQVNKGDEKDVTEGSQVGTTQFQMDTYTAQGLVKNGTLTLNFNIADGNNISWLSFKNVKYTKVRDLTAEEEFVAATAVDYTDLNNAINAHVIGFEKDEYAPYNNVAAVTAVAAAKAIDQDANNAQEDVQAATAAITGATWTANAAEVNAICGGDFTQYETVGGQDLPYGWNLYNTGNNSRIMGGTEGTSNAGLSAASSGKALLMKFNATYGESVGYTMPLKAGKIYKITFKYGGWSNAPATIVSLTDPSDAAITLAPDFRPATQDAHTDATHWYDYTGYFAATTDGDYKINFNKVESGQQQIVIADIDIRTASELTFADGSVPTYAPGTYPTVKITRTLTAGKWATAVYPFAVSGIDNIAVLDSYDGHALGFASADKSEANVPFLMRSNNDKSEITLNDVEVAAAAATDAVKGDASLKGTYATANITNEATNFVLSNNTIYAVGGAGATINPYRAYIQLAQPAEARTLGFFVDGEDVTGIISVNANQKVHGRIFNLNGQRVDAAKKGLYILNGKKMVVK